MSIEIDYFKTIFVNNFSSNNAIIAKRTTGGPS